MPAEQATPNVHHGTPGPPDATLAILLDSSCAGGLRQNSASFSASDGDEYKDIRSVTREISSANPAIGSYSVEWLGSETYGESHQASLHSESSSAPKRSLPDENSSTSRANKRRCLVVLPSPDCTARPTTKDQDHAQTLQVVSSQVNNERSPLKDISAATTMSPGAMAVKMVCRVADRTRLLRMALDNSYIQRVYRVTRAQYDRHELMWDFVLTILQRKRQTLRKNIEKMEQDGAPFTRCEPTSDDNASNNCFLTVVGLENAKFLWKSHHGRFSDGANKIKAILSSISASKTLDPDIATVWHLSQLCGIWKEKCPRFENFCHPIEQAERDNTLWKSLDRILPRLKEKAQQDEKVDVVQSTEVQA